MVERERPEGKQIPEAWIGHLVQLVFVSGSSTEYIDGMLEEVNDRVLSCRLAFMWDVQNNRCSTRGALTPSFPRIRAGVPGA